MNIGGAEGALPSWRRYFGPGGIAKLVVLATLIVWLYWDQIYRLWIYWQKPDWQHGFLIPIYCLYLVNSRKQELMAAPAKGSIWGLGLLLLAIYVYVECIKRKFGYPQSVSMVMLIASLVLLLGGWRPFKLTLFPIGFLLLALPPPDRLYREITQPLQQGAALIAGKVLNAFPGADIEQSGINIAYFMSDGTSGSFTIAGACSGMRSLMAFVALGLGAAYFTPRPLWHRITMAAVVIPVALFCNILRVLITGGFQMYGNKDWATGTPHMILGLALFALGMVIYLGILWVLDHAFVDDKHEGDAVQGVDA